MIESGWDLPPVAPKTPRVLEADVEEYLVKEVEKRGGTAEKFKSPNRVNVPDRLVSWPEDWSNDGEPRPASVAFVECKAPGKKPSAAQQRDHDRRRAMGFRVYVVDTFEAVDKFIQAEGV